MRPSNVFRAALGSVGVTVMAVAAWGILRDRGFTHPPGLAVWLGGGVVAHDFLLAPLSLAVGAVASRVIPRRARRPVAYGLVTGAVILVVGVPVLLASHRDRANPTILGQNYATGLIVAELVVLVLTALAAFVALRRRGAPG